jgi:hypothetical protein
LYSQSREITSPVTAKSRHPYGRDTVIWGCG